MLNSRIAKQLNIRPPDYAEYYQSAIPQTLLDAGAKRKAYRRDESMANLVGMGDEYREDEEAERPIPLADVISRRSRWKRIRLDLYEKECRKRSSFSASHIRSL